mgnify:CR=1 FL=1
MAVNKMSEQLTIPEVDKELVRIREEQERRLGQGTLELVAA